MLFSPEDVARYEVCISDHTYALYHDESNKDGYWHGMLLVPCNKRDQFFDILQSYRKLEGYFDKISFKDIKSTGEKFRLADDWLQVGVGFLRSQPNKQKYPVKNWNQPGNPIHQGTPYVSLPIHLMGAKFILFRVKDDHENMVYLNDKVSKVETTLRMGIAGGLHALGSPEHRIHITKIHLDGYQHNLRHADTTRIVDRIYGLREYCSFALRESLIDDRSSDPKSQNHQDYIDCEFLALTDLLIGSFRVALSQFEKNDHKRKLSHHAKHILERMTSGKSSMKQSRWANSFWLSECEIIDNQWVFNNIELRNQKDRNCQLPLEFLML
jgi:hypothetical protein